MNSIQKAQNKSISIFKSLIFYNDSDNFSASLRLSIIEYSVFSLFQISNNECKSHLKSYQVISVSTNFRLMEENQKLVNLGFKKFEEKKCGYSGKFEYKCVFWDFSLDNGNGNWSTNGCTLRINNSMFTCICNHTTNFAILIVHLDFTFKLQNKNFKLFSERFG